jgi:PKD repeat protein
MKNNKLLFLVLVTLSILLMPIASADGNVKINDFTANVTHGSAPLAVRFNVNISGEVTVWKWEFYNKQIDHWTYGGGKGNLVTDNHTFKKSGVYNVTLIVVGPDGSDALKKVAYITVYPQGSTPPVAAFSASLTSGTVPLAVTFIDQSTGTPTSWNWDFGDGTHSSVQNPIHKYTKEGKYTVSLKVNNSVDSNTVTKSNYAIVTASKPVVVFSASPISGKSPLKVQFSDKSTNNPVSWKWSFGDGISSTQKNPLHTYNKAGKYTVKLTVKNAAGSSTKTMSITVK